MLMEDHVEAFDRINGLQMLSMKGAVDIKDNAWRIMVMNVLVDPPGCV